MKMAEKLAKSFIGLFGGIAGSMLGKYLIIFIISLCPILECRGGLIAASLLGVPLLKALPICIIGNLLPIPFILLFIEKIFDWLKNTRFVKLVNKLEQKAQKNAQKIMKHKTFGLFLFVGIPLPGTGAWTGALVAALFKFKFKDAIKSIIPGVLLAALIISLLFYGLVDAVIAIFA